MKYFKFIVKVIKLNCYYFDFIKLFYKCSWFVYNIKYYKKYLIYY